MNQTSIERPTGISILAALQVIGGVFAVLGGLLVLAAGAYFGEGFWAVISIVVFLLGFFSIVVGWGLWNLRKWAYQVAMILAVIGIITALLSLPGSILTLVIDGIIIYYLTRPEIKEVFEITGFLS